MKHSIIKRPILSIIKYDCNISQGMKFSNHRCFWHKINTDDLDISIKINQTTVNTKWCYLVINQSVVIRNLKKVSLFYSVHIRKTQYMYNYITKANSVFMLAQTVNYPPSASLLQLRQKVHVLQYKTIIITSNKK